MRLITFAKYSPASAELLFRPVLKIISGTEASEFALTAWPNAEIPSIPEREAPSLLMYLQKSAPETNRTCRIKNARLVPIGKSDPREHHMWQRFIGRVNLAFDCDREQVILRIGFVKING